MSFWTDLKNNSVAIRQEWEDLWEKAGSGYISPAQAKRTLEVLYLRSHLDLLENASNYKKFFPTKQCYPGRLKKVKSLWWVDHATAGINGWGTLKWFSSKPRGHAKKFDTKAAANAYAKRRKGKVSKSGTKYVVKWKGYAGACTHFTVFTNGLPFMLLRLDDGCWGEPKRNGDGIHIEMVNALICRQKNQTWYFWAGPIPQSILDVQMPVRLDESFRGAKVMLPYTWDQVVTNIKLKRLCVAATTEQLRPEDVELTPRMALDRMSQHTDWRTSKYDMGPLWPFDMCNQAAFENLPIESYDFVQRFIKAPGMDDVVDLEELKQLEAWAADEDQEHELYDEDTSIDSIKEVQQTLIKIYGSEVLPKYGADGDCGTETRKAVRRFQNNWNKNNPYDTLKVDGVPGTQTCARLESAVKQGDNFKQI
jgi:hypothetical protein